MEMENTTLVEIAKQMKIGNKLKLLEMKKEYFENDTLEYDARTSDIEAQLQSCFDEYYKEELEKITNEI